MVDSRHVSFVNPRVLKINVGFLLAESAGYQRVIALDLPRVRLDHEMELDLECLRGNIRLSRNSRGILVQGTLEARILAECSRCLEVFEYPESIELEELFVFPPSSDSAYSVEETGFLDLTPLLREETILSVPMGVVCRPDCAGLCPECGKNLNEGPCECEIDDTDPRFALLRAHLKDLHEPHE